MNNWRRPLIQLFDTYVKCNRIHDYVAMLRDFYLLPTEEQQRVQEERLAELLRHAALRVPYYREVLTSAGAFLNGNIDLSRFRHIPFLTKDILRSQFDQLKSDDLHSRHWYKNTSGGSTGEPVVFIQDSLYSDLNNATAIIRYERLGKRLGEPHVQLWGSERDILQASIGLRAKLGNFLRNYTFLNSFRMTEEDMAHYVSIIKSIKPKIIVSYAQSAYELAQYINSEGIHITGVGAVMTCAGTLLPFMRQEIQQAFRCEVFNHYGSREVGGIASETLAHDGLHVDMYTHLVEVVDSSGEPVQPGETGKIIVTGLHNFAMPLIRYRIGDLGIPATEPSGAALGISRLQTVTGRTVDIFITADGTRVDGEYFTHLVYFRDWIKKFQFVQESHNLVVFRVIRRYDANFEERELSDIEDKIKLVMGQDCQVRFDFVDEIPSSASGKYRYTISKVQRS